MHMRLNFKLRAIAREKESDFKLRDFKAKLLSLLTSIPWTACCCKLNNQSSGCRPKCCYNQSEFFHDHRFHDRSSRSRPEYSIAVAHPYYIVYNYLETQICVWEKQKPSSFYLFWICLGHQNENDDMSGLSALFIVKTFWVSYCHMSLEKWMKSLWHFPFAEERGR